MADHGSTQSMGEQHGASRDASDTAQPIRWLEPAALQAALQCFQTLFGAPLDTVSPANERVVYRINYYAPNHVYVVMQCDDVELEVRLGDARVLMVVAGYDMFLTEPERARQTLENVRQLFNDPRIDIFIANCQHALRLQAGSDSTERG